MQGESKVVDRMNKLVTAWEKDGDRRASFLGCYALMTKNMLQAIDEGRFIDKIWVHQLLHLFADYYFRALDQYDHGSEDMPPVWRFVHDNTCQCSLHVLQDLLLGINAHINYDLVFTLADMLGPEWESLTPGQRQNRYQDHRTVNDVIGETIDVVQDSIIEPRAPWLDIVDRLFGRVDELLLSRLISAWREEVWKEAVRLVETSDRRRKMEIQREIEAKVMERAQKLVSMF